MALASFDIFKNDPDCNLHIHGPCFINVCKSTVELGQWRDIDFSSPVPVDPQIRTRELFKRWLKGESAAGYYSEPFKLRYREGSQLVNLGLQEGTQVELLKVPFQQTWTNDEDICLSFKMIKPNGQVNQMTLTKGGTLGEMKELF